MTTLPIASEAEPRNPPRAMRRMPGTPALAVAAVLGISACATTAIVVAAGMSLELSGFLRFIVMAGVMGALSYWCRARGLDMRLGTAAAIVGTATISLMICGIASNAGLRLGMPMADAWLAAADAALGLDAGTIIRAVAAHPMLTSVLSLLYNSSGIAVVVLIGWTLTHRSVSKAWELVMTAVVAMQLVALISPAFPAWGAMRTFALEGLQGHGLPVGAGTYQWSAFSHFYSGHDPLLRLADMDGVVAFPSFHTVLALMITQALGDTPLRPLAIIWTAGIMLSAIPMGGHYVVDLVAGVVIWAAAAIFSRRVSNPSA